MVSLAARIKRNVAPPAPDPGDRFADVVPLHASAVSYNAERGMTAAAERINLKKPDDKNTLIDRPWSIWQRDAWEYYDAIAEVKYAYTLLSAVMSRLRLYAALNLDPDSPPASTLTVRRRRAGQTENEQIADRKDELIAPDSVTDEVMAYMEDLTTDLGSGHGGMPGFLRSFALNMSVPGECYLCRIDNRWSIRSTEEITVRADKTAVLRVMRSGRSMSPEGNTRDRVLPENTYIGRIWKAHPRFSGEPDSAMLGLREMCDELLTLQRMIRTIARSKMNAGMLFVPDGISAASTSVGSTAEESENEADPFEQELMLSIVTPISDESSASTVVPMVARGPLSPNGRSGIEYITFTREADKDLVARADRALDRILQGIDVPKDIVTGLSNVKYSNAVQIDESLYSSHIEPLALVLVDALTMIYLRPALAKKFPSLTADDLSKCVIWYDPTEVVTKPDAASAAGRLYDNLELSGAALRKANGFNDTDAPDENEIASRIASKQVMPPELVSALIKHMLPDVFKEQQAAAVQGSPTPMPESAQRMLYPDQQPSSAADPVTPSTPPALIRRTRQTL